MPSLYGNRPVDKTQPAGWSAALYRVLSGGALLGLMSLVITAATRYHRPPCEKEPVTYESQDQPTEPLTVRLAAVSPTENRVVPADWKRVQDESVEQRPGHGLAEAVKSSDEVGVETVQIQLCQAWGPAQQMVADGFLPLEAVGCQFGCGPECRWPSHRQMAFQEYGPGEYVGPPRPAPIGAYRLRVDDELLYFFRLTRNRTATEYRLNVGDQLQVESVKNEEINRNVQIQSDGSVTLFVLGPVPAAGRTIEELRSDIQKRYETYYTNDLISITPEKIDTKLQDLLAAVDNRQGNQGGQTVSGRVTPEGTVQLPAIGSVPVQGLTIDELATEVNYRYASVVAGLEVTPVLTARATPYAYVLGEVNAPGRVELLRPTTVMQAVALAGGWRRGGNLRQIVVFRRTDSWHLMATKIDLRGALIGKRPCPADEIWLRDSDLVVIPPTPFKRASDLIQSIVTDGANDVILFGSAAGFLTLSTL